MSPARRQGPAAPRPVRRAVAFVVRETERPRRVLLVRRPPDDEELPGVWGLPAGSLRPGESHEEALARSGRDKLGVELLVGREIGRGRLERDGYTLEMTLFEASVERGRPEVPQSVPGITQYTEWRWGEPEELRASAERGSLCSTLFLAALSEEERQGR